MHDLTVVPFDKLRAFDARPNGRCPSTSSGHSMHDLTVVPRMAEGVGFEPTDL
jgi:hypothetical protein